MEETLRVGDAGQRMHTLPAKACKEAFPATAQGPRTVDAQAHRPFAKTEATGTAVSLAWPRLTTWKSQSRARAMDSRSGPAGIGWPLP